MTERDCNIRNTLCPAALVLWHFHINHIDEIELIDFARYIKGTVPGHNHLDLSVSSGFCRSLLSDYRLHYFDPSLVRI